MYPTKQIVKKIFRTAGLNVQRAEAPTVTREANAYSNYDFETDETFKSFFREAVQATGSTHDPEVVHQRIYNTVQFLKHVLDLEGDVVECGVFQGLCSYLFCSYLRRSNPNFKGEGYHVFDSFEGLSQPSEQDKISQPEYGVVGTHFRPAGEFKGTLETVKSTLKDYPAIEYHAGWIPQSLEGLPERTYRFVHIDLDLYEPIKGAIGYFYPRMVNGGILVIDEYAIPRWPGARRAVDEFCEMNNLLHPVSLTTGNGVMIKK